MVRALFIPLPLKKRKEKPLRVVSYTYRVRWKYSRVVSVAYRMRQSIASNVLFVAVRLTLEGARFRAKF